MDVTACSSWLVADWQKSPHVKVGGWRWMHLDSCQLSCQERQSRTTVSIDITVGYIEFETTDSLSNAI